MALSQTSSSTGWLPGLGLVGVQRLFLIDENIERRCLKPRRNPQCFDVNSACLQSLDYLLATSGNCSEILIAIFVAKTP